MSRLVNIPLDNRSHILAQVDVLFSQYGIKSITMDDIAKHLGMSKKTIYLYFKDKNDLVLELMRTKIDAQCCVINDCRAKASNAIHELFFGIANLEAMLSKTNPTMFYDLQKFYPQAWAYFKDFRERILLEKVRENLSWGVQEGYFRSEMDLEVLSRMRVEQIEFSFNQFVFPVQQFSVLHVAKELTLHFIYGICTPKGYELTKQYEQAH
ncbi:MAG: TetR/AcrR family transcriptional regulator [Sphingobacteriaceae bacterium]